MYNTAPCLKLQRQAMVQLVIIMTPCCIEVNRTQVVVDFKLTIDYHLLGIK